MEDFNKFTVKMRNVVLQQFYVHINFSFQFNNKSVLIKATGRFLVLPGDWINNLPNLYSSELHHKGQ
jgi:hypothetical protein